MMMAPVSDFYEQIGHESVTVLVCHFCVVSSSEKNRLWFHDDGTSEEPVTEGLFRYTLITVSKEPPHVFHKLFGSFYLVFICLFRKKY